MRILAGLLLLASCSGSGGGSDGASPVLPPVASCSVGASPSWKAALALPSEPFVRAATNLQLPGWVKFTVLECDPTKVYFQDGNTYAFHYDFAAAELDPLAGLTPAEFDAKTLYDRGREAILGAVLLPPPGLLLFGVEEFGIQLVGLDPLPVARVIELFARVRDRLGVGPATPVYYMPTFEQEAAARADEAVLEAAGIRLSSSARWSVGDAVYSEGWALGRLRVLAPADVDESYLSGALAPSDVLYTDGVAASLPLVAGILTATPATPSSHVAILSQTFGVPFGYLADEEERARVRGLDGRLVLVRAYVEPAGTELDVVDVEDLLDAGQVAEVLSLRQPPALDLAVLEPAGGLSRPAASLTLDDARHVGGKAAGFGILARSLPDRSPRALALTFDLWSGFLDQPLAGGLPLRQELANLLGGEVFPPVDVASLFERLAIAREWIRDPDLTAFAPGHEDGVLAALVDPAAGFDAGAKLRFRSSSNLEDAEQFTGAGLYSSFSGCLADELDGDEAGPSHCDPDKTSERGVFRAIRKVFASFYDDAAFLARLEYGVSEGDVGMAVLVHHSFPDELELANGVARFHRREFGYDTLEIVSQAGAHSVTNPELGELPEVVRADVFGTFEPFFDLEQASNLTQLGATVLEWEAGYLELVELFQAAVRQFELETGETELLLEFEFKNLAPGGAALPGGGLVVKQLRRLPIPDSSPTTVPFLIGAPIAYETFQGEAFDVFANHRLKSELVLEARTGWLDQSLSGMDLVTEARLRFTDECTVREETFDVADPLRVHQVFDGAEYRLALEQPQLANPRKLEVVFSALPQLVGEDRPPVLFLRDLLRPRLDVEYQLPVLKPAGLPGPGLVPVYEESAQLTLPEAVEPGDLEQTRRIVDGGVSIDVRFWWPRQTGVAGGYTAPLVGWGETVISGLTGDPIVLRGEYSQSYRPAHHNFTEAFLFQPGLEPDLPDTTRAELEALGVHLISAEGSPFATGDRIELFSRAELGVACDPPAGSGR